MNDFTEKVQAMLDAAKRGNWSFCRYAETDKEWLKKEIACLLDNEGAGDICYFVGTDDDLVVALTGNGPTSAQNAELIAAVPTLLREACERIEALWKERDRLAGIVEKADALADLARQVFVSNGPLMRVAYDRLCSYKETRHG